MAREPEGDAPYMTARLVAWRRATDGPFLLVAIASLPVLLLELKRSDLSHADRVFLDVVNVAVLALFAADYLVEISLAQRRGLYARNEWTSAAIVLSQAIALVPAFGAFGVFRVLRGARAFRAIAVVLRLLAIGGASAREGRSVIRRKAGRFALSLAVLTWVTSAVAFTLAENVGEGGRVHSFGDALWWSAATITTVGYGDIYPVTFVGRAVGVATMVVGVSVFAVVTAKVAEFLVRTAAEDRAAEAERS